MSERQRIRNPKENFTILPNMYDDADLNAYEFRLLVHYRRVGNCYESLRTTAKKCHMGKTSVEKHRDSLAEKGWIVLAATAKGTIAVEVVDRWSRTPTSGGAFQGVRLADSSEEAVRHTDAASATGTGCPSGGIKEVLIKKDSLRRTGDSLSFSQDPLIKAKITILNQITRYRPHMKEVYAPQFDEFYDPTWLAGTRDGIALIVCVGEDPEYQKAYLSDRESIFRRNLLIDGKQIKKVCFVTEAELEKAL